MRAPFRWYQPIAALAFFAGVALLGVHELRTSKLQSWAFTKMVAGIGWELGKGPSDEIRFPKHGPFDQRFGYTEIPSLVEKAADAGFQVRAQARVSSRFAELVDRGSFPIYAEKPQGGLTLVDRSGKTFFAARHGLMTKPTQA